MKLKFVILLLFPILSFSQLSVKVDSLYKEINANNQVKNNFIGMGSNGMIDEEYDSLFSKLDSIATDDEIIYIASKGNTSVKYQMNGILVARKSKHLTDLFTQYIFNDEKIYIRGGCTGIESSIAGEIYSYIFYQKNMIDEIEIYKKAYTIEELKKNHLPYETKWTKPEVDSLLFIFNKIVLSNDSILPVTLNHVFRLNKFKFGNYERVKYFAYKYPTPEILGTLASYQNKEDLPLFHQNIDNAFIAISKFPDKSFIPDIKSRIDSKNLDSYEFLEATTSFCDKDAEELLYMVVAEFEKMKDEKKQLWLGDGERLGGFYKFLEKRNCAVNDEFLVKMWTEQRMISYSFFNKIKDKHYNEILKGYLNDIPFSSGPDSDDFDYSKYKDEWEATDGYLCPIILKYLKNNSSLSKNKTIDLSSIQCKG